MKNRTISDQIAAVRCLCQSFLSRKTLAVGVASSESFLLLRDRLWGVKFSLGCFHARWQIGHDQILLFEEDRLIDQFSVGGENAQKAA
jgi:hypothetical protein